MARRAYRIFSKEFKLEAIRLAEESGKPKAQVAISVGCMLSRVRTGMSNNEMTAAIPAGRLHEVVEKLRTAAGADKDVAGYASEDSKRFGAYLGR